MVWWPCRAGQYLGRYTHRVAISNHRLVSFQDDQVTFRWRDSSYHNQQELRSLPVDKFLSRFRLHLLPQGFVRIRHFGFLASRRRAKFLPLCFHLLGAPPPPHAKNTHLAPKTLPIFILALNAAVDRCESKRLCRTRAEHLTLTSALLKRLLPNPELRVVR